MLPDAEQLRRQVRELVRAFRHGSLERRLAILAVLLFVAAGAGYGPLPETLIWAKSWITLGGTILGAIVVLILVRTVWKQALPTELLPAAMSPSAIKGPTPFSPQDGELFLKLGRTEELRKLLSWVLDDQIPGVIVTGESGAGKTSLLRAGLAQTLRPHEVAVLYWEAQRHGAAQSFLSALEVHLPGAGGAPESGAATVEALSDRLLGRAGRSVLVLDQFEQLDSRESDHALLFDLLERMYKSPAPHRVKTIVALRTESAGLWFHFEATRLGGWAAVPRLSLRLFTEQQATNVMAALAESAGFTLDDDLVQDFLRAARKAEGVSPVEIGIGLLVLSELATRTGRSYLRMDDYRFGGGSLGVLTAYLRDRLEHLGEGERSGLIKALLLLVDLERNQRIAEGRSVADLAVVSGVSPSRLRTVLNYLASAQVRLLETMENGEGESRRYRLPHERLVPALRLVGGQLLVDVERVKLRYEAQLRGWNLNNRPPKYLLSGKDLRMYLRYRTQIPPGEDRGLEEEYLRKSIRRRSWRHVAGAVGAIVAVTVLALGWQRYQGVLLENELSAWQLPLDLVAAARAPQLNALRLHGAFPHVPWLRSREHFPNLTTLDLSATRSLTSLAGLEKLPNLTTLDLSATRNLTSLAGLEKLPNLTTLNLSATRSLTSLAGLEKLPNLTRLDLSETGLTSLEGLARLAKLKAVGLLGLRLQYLKGLPPSVEEVILGPRTLDGSTRFRG